MFELFAHRPAHVDLVVRAMHDRALAGGGKLAAAIAEGPCLGYATQALRARPGVPARTARLKIRFGRLDLRPPQESRKGLRPGPVSMAYVDLREETPPDGVEAGGEGSEGSEGARPVHWRLLTTRAVETVAEAPRSECGTAGVGRGPENQPESYDTDTGAPCGPATTRHRRRARRAATGSSRRATARPRPGCRR